MAWAVLLSALALGGACWRQGSAEAILHRRDTFVLHESTQLMVVVTPEWDAQTGILQRYERSRPDQRWVAVGHPIGVVVGHTGMGWGAATANADPGTAKSPKDPVKKEGDLRSPAGIFSIGTSFGYAEEEPAGWRMPYLRLTPSVECVDDPQSAYYNQVVDRSTVTPDWKSSEKMLRPDGLYQWGLVIAQNIHPVRPGKGSCVFLHVWPGPGEATVGCTATAVEQMQIILGWLDPARAPMLVQLPAAQYTALEKSWELPPLPKAANGGT
ncbi:MAG TPA: hypothetical protein VHX11_03370 [Acidobacteriaceae bacterium]|jgi:D-alanyl-D-alanine dipeptidase|nr:hypothetical protein [Acidobacteriaceae bacterium]